MNNFVGTCCQTLVIPSSGPYNLSEALTSVAGLPRDDLWSLGGSYLTTVRLGGSRLRLYRVHPLLPSLELDAGRRGPCRGPPRAPGPQRLWALKRIYVATVLATPTHTLSSCIIRGSGAVSQYVLEYLVLPYLTHTHGATQKPHNSHNSQHAHSTEALSARTAHAQAYRLTSQDHASAHCGTTTQIRKTPCGKHAHS